MSDETIMLYGIPLSLYTGKARSYLIKNGIPYREQAPTTHHFIQNVVPRAGGFSLPAIETAEGVVRDSTEIVDFFESRRGHPATPTGPRQRIVAGLLDVIGMEGLLRPAMHYRWNFPSDHDAYLAFHFQSLAAPGFEPAVVAEKVMGRMRHAAIQFGVAPAAIAGVESRYAVLLETLDRHFAEVPYLLGGRPCIGDFGLIAPMYGHLGRDPKPLSLLNSKALRVLRWVERMNRPEPDRGEYVAAGEPRFGDVFLAVDEIPETLVAVLRQMAVDFVPETMAAAGFVNQWLEDNADLPPGTPVERGVGRATFEVEGESIEALAQPHRFYLLSRVQSEFDALSRPDQMQVEQVLGEAGLLPVLGARLSREIEFRDNVEIWGAASGAI